jgi:hypothetical protein
MKYIKLRPLINIIIQYTSETGSVESMPISMLKVGSYYRNNRLSFKVSKVSRNVREI